MSLWLDELWDQLVIIACGIGIMAVVFYQDPELGFALLIIIASLILVGLSPRIFRAMANFLLDAANPGIRDPDPVEAAVLMRAAPGRTLTIIMFGLMKKGNVKLTSVEPVRLEIVSKKGLNYYERLFVGAIKDDLLAEQKMIDCFRELNRRILERAPSPSRERMAEQCRGRIADAWSDLESVDTPQLRQQMFDDNILWLITDDDYARKITGDLRAPGWDPYSVSVNPSWYRDLMKPPQGTGYPSSSPDLQYALTQMGERAARKPVEDSEEARSWGEVQNPFFNIPDLDYGRP